MAKKERSEDRADELSVPKAVVSRLSLYLRELQQLERDGKATISSNQLGKLLGFTDAQVRKDLANFGQFGYPGVGYRCAELINAIRQILGTTESWPVALLGVGNLGRALLGYRGFGSQGFEVVAAFDADPAVVGGEAPVPVFLISELAEQAKLRKIKLAVLAVPAEAAQEVANYAVEAGIDGILNFAPITLSLPDHVQSIGVDLAIQLEQLAFAVVNRANKA